MVRFSCLFFATTCTGLCPDSSVKQIYRRACFGVLRWPPGTRGRLRACHVSGNRRTDTRAFKLPDFFLSTSHQNRCKPHRQDVNEGYGSTKTAPLMTSRFSMFSKCGAAKQEAWNSLKQTYICLQNFYDICGVAVVERLPILLSIEGAALCRQQSGRSVM